MRAVMYGPTQEGLALTGWRCGQRGGKYAGRAPETVEKLGWGGLISASCTTTGSSTYVAPALMRSSLQAEKQVARMPLARGKPSTRRAEHSIHGPWHMLAYFSMITVIRASSRAYELRAAAALLATGFPASAMATVISSIRLFRRM